MAASALRDEMAMVEAARATASAELEAAMAACAKAGELSRVEELEAEGRAAGLPLGKQTLQATLMACRAAGDAASAVRAYRQWQRRADVPSALVKHIEEGVRITARDPKAVLVFSGGQTRRAFIIPPASSLAVMRQQQQAPATAPKAAPSADDALAAMAADAGAGDGGGGSLFD